MEKDNLNIKEKVCIITGGAGLLGSEFCRVCALNGAKVVIIDLNERKGKELAISINKENKNDNVIFKKCNILDEKQIKKATVDILKKFGRIDVLVNNAYPRNKNYGKKFEDVSFVDFCENLSNHVGGYFLVTKEVSAIMKKQKAGNIIFMGSIYGFSAPKFEVYSGTEMTMPVEYSAIKGGIINLSKYLASYLGPYNIRVNSISPGGVFDGQNREFVKKYTQYIKLGEKRMAKVGDVSGVLLFLISNLSSYMTGQNIVVDGGWTI